MAYSFPWNNAVPAGTDPANQLDTNITDLKSALSERMENKFISSMTADPWVVKPEILGNVTSKEIYVGFYEFQFPSINSMNIDFDQILTPAVGGSTYVGQANVILPAGCIIQEVHAMYKGNGTDASTVALYEVDYATTPAHALVSILMSRTLHSYAETNSTGINHTVVANKILMLRADLKDKAGSSAGMIGCRIVYDTPDCRNTI